MWYSYRHAIPPTTNIHTLPYSRISMRLDSLRTLLPVASHYPQMTQYLQPMATQMVPSWHAWPFSSQLPADKPLYPSNNSPELGATRVVSPASTASSVQRRRKWLCGWRGATLAFVLLAIIIVSLVGVAIYRSGKWWWTMRLLGESVWNPYFCQITLSYFLNHTIMLRNVLLFRNTSRTGRIGLILTRYTGLNMLEV